MNFNELACQVEEVVCNHIDANLASMFQSTKKGDCVKARHLSIFVLHTLYHVPISWLSIRYKFSTRHIFRAVAQIRDYIRTNRQYRDLCESIRIDMETLTLTK